MANLAQQLEEATAAVLGQRIYAIEYRAFLEEFQRLLDALPGQLEEAAQSLDPLVWEKLNSGYLELVVANRQLVQFCLEADLSMLDLGVASCRRADYLLLEAEALQLRLAGDSPLLTALQATLTLKPPLPDFDIQVTRQAGVSRAVFSCPRCGWEFSYVQEIDSTDFLELPLSDFSCPLCEDADSASSDDPHPAESPPSGSPR